LIQNQFQKFCENHADNVGLQLAVGAGFDLTGAIKRWLIPWRLGCIHLRLHGGQPFHARTVEINAHGGLISLQTAVRPGQKLLVMNKGNESAQQRVVQSVRVRQERAFDVRFAFSTPIPQFWQNLDTTSRI
jgi:hypothetical protein